MQPPKAADASDAEPRPEEGQDRAQAPAQKPAPEQKPSSATERERKQGRDQEPAQQARPHHLVGSTLSTVRAAEEADRVSGDEPLLPARVHRPSDLMRVLVGVLAIAILFSIAAFAHGTTTGLENDINKGTDQAPDVLIKIAGLVSSIAVLLVPVAFAIERLIKRDGLRIADGVLPPCSRTG